MTKCIVSCFTSLYFQVGISCEPLQPSSISCDIIDRTLMLRQSEIGCRPSLRHRIYFPLFKVCVSQLALASLFAIAIPIRPAHAINDFQLCTAQLVRLAGVSPEGAADACSDVLNPKDLSRCVVTIHKLTPTLTQDALVACQRVRRPVEFSHCVFDITDNTRDSQPPEVLDYCRRSLLPMRYAECVVGLSRETDFSSSKMLESCIKAEDLPRNLFPSFAPPPPQNPTPPPAVPSISPTPSTNPIKPNS